MGDYFCCVCRTFTWQTALFLHLECTSAKNLVKDGSWGSLFYMDKDTGVNCKECEKPIAGNNEKGHYRICPSCFEQKRHLQQAIFQVKQ